MWGWEYSAILRFVVLIKVLETLLKGILWLRTLTFVRPNSWQEPNALIHQYNESVMSREKNHIGHFGSSLSQSYSKWQKLKSSTTASPHVVVLCRMLLWILKNLPYNREIPRCFCLLNKQNDQWWYSRKVFPITLSNFPNTQQLHTMAWRWNAILHL